MRSARVLLLVAGVALVGSVLQSCKTAPYVWIDDYPAQPDRSGEPYRIRKGDRLRIGVWKQPEMSTEAWVRPDGKVSVALAGDVVVVGFTPDEAAKAIEAALAGKVTAPVSVTVIESRADSVAVLGEVTTPGRYVLKRGDTVLDGLAQAGGLTEFARRDRIFVIRRGEAYRIRFTFDKLAGGQGRAIRFHLEDGDIIVVE